MIRANGVTSTGAALGEELFGSIATANTARSVSVYAMSPPYTQTIPGIALG